MGEPAADPAAPRREALACAAVSVALGAALLAPRYLPMTDLPQHEFMVGALRGLGDPARFPPELYARNLGHANQLFHVAGWALSSVLPVDRACQLLAAATVAGALLALQRAAHAAGKSPWVSLLAAPVALGMMFRWGLIANLVGFALYVAALPAMERHVARPTARSAATVSLAGLALYAAHNAAPFYVGATLVPWALVFARRDGLRGLAMRLAPLVPVALAVVVGYLRFRAGMTRGFLTMTAMDSRWLLRWPDLPANILGLGDLARTLPPLALAAVAVALLRMAPAPDVKTFGAADVPDAPPLWAHRYALLAAVMFAQYAVWPYGVSGSGLLYQRFLPPGLAALLLALAPAAGARTSVLARAAAAVVPCAVLFAQLDDLVACHRGYAELDPIVAAVAPGSPVASLNFTEAPASMALFNHAHAHLAASRGGRTSDLMATLPHMPVVYRPGTARERQSRRIALNPMRFAPADDLRQFRYVLARVPDADFGRALAFVLREHAALRAQSGRWLLFESRYPVAPLAAPEAPPPRSPSLGALFRGLRGPR